MSTVTLLGRTANLDIAALEKPHCGQMPRRSIGAYFGASSMPPHQIVRDSISGFFVLMMPR